MNDVHVGEFCWGKVNNKWQKCILIAWALESAREGDTFPVAVVEAAADGRVHSVYVGLISFSEEKPVD